MSRRRDVPGRERPFDDLLRDHRYAKLALLKEREAERAAKINPVLNHGEIGERLLLYDAEKDKIILKRPVTQTAEMLSNSIKTGSGEMNENITDIDKIPEIPNDDVSFCDPEENSHPVKIPQEDKFASNELDIGPEIKPSDELDIQPNIKPLNELDIEPEIKPSNELDIQPEIKSSNELEIRPEIKPSDELDIQPEIKSRPSPSQVEYESQPKNNTFFESQDHVKVTGEKKPDKPSMLYTFGRLGGVWQHFIPEIRKPKNDVSVSYVDEGLPDNQTTSECYKLADITETKLNETASAARLKKRPAQRKAGERMLETESTKSRTGRGLSECKISQGSAGGGLSESSSSLGNAGEGLSGSSSNHSSTEGRLYEAGSVTGARFQGTVSSQCMTASRIPGDAFMTEKMTSETSSSPIVAVAGVSMAASMTSVSLSQQSMDGEKLHEDGFSHCIIRGMPQQTENISGEIKSKICCNQNVAPEKMSQHINHILSKFQLVELTKLDSQQSEMSVPYKNSKPTKINQHTKDSQPAKTNQLNLDNHQSKTNQPTEDSQPAKTNQLNLDNHPTKTNQPTQDSGPIKDNQLNLDNQPTKTNQPTQDSQPIKNNRLDLGNQLTKNSQPTEGNQLSMSNQPVENNQPTENNQPIKDNQLNLDNHPTNNNQQNTDNQPIKNNQQAQKVILR